LLKTLLIIFISLFLSQNSYAKSITIGLAGIRAPWVIPESQSGIIIDLFSEAMEPLGYKVKKVFFPYTRRIKSYKAQQVDVISDINPFNIINSNLSGYFSGIIYAYENHIYALKKRNYNFIKVSELRNHSLLSWQGAKKALGHEYELMASNNPLYSESHNQKLQVKMLFMERFDAIQIDKQIFEYYRAIVAKEKEIDTSPKIDSFPLFGKNPNGFMFHSLKVRDDFVKQITIMKADGRYDKIFNKYKTTSH
jgi:polar amino acid transport system substrate-binding protein